MCSSHNLRSCSDMNGTLSVELDAVVVAAGVDAAANDAVAPENAGVVAAMAQSSQIVWAVLTLGLRKVAC